MTAVADWDIRFAQARGEVVAIDPSARARVAQQAAARGLAVVAVDLRAARDPARVLAAFAEALRFPAYFGHNWDALEECLTDLAWLPAPGYAVLIAHAAADAELAGARDSLVYAARAWGARGVPFWALLVAEPPG